MSDICCETLNAYFTFGVPLTMSYLLAVDFKMQL